MIHDKHDSSDAWNNLLVCLGIAVVVALYTAFVIERTTDAVQRAIMNDEYLHDTVAMVPAHEKGDPYITCMWLWHKGKKVKDTCP